MADVGLADYVEMLLPTLEALNELGGSGTTGEVDEKTLLHLRSNLEKSGAELPPYAVRDRSAMMRQLAWARTYLKKFGAIDNRRRGVWTLEAQGRKYLEMDSTEAVTALRTAYAQVRRQLRARRNTARKAATTEPGQTATSPHRVDPSPCTPHPGDGGTSDDGSGSPRRLSRRELLGALGAVGLAAAGAVGYLEWARPAASRRVASARMASVAVGRERRTEGLNLVAVDQLPDRMMLQFSSPVRTVTSGENAPALPEIVQTSPLEVSIPKSPAGYQGTLEVAGWGGDQISVPLQVPPLSPAPVHWFGDDRGGRVYLTIDDGWYPNSNVLALMQEQRLPLTTFLIQQAAVRHAGFWQSFAAAGGLIMNHTYSHPNLTGLSPAQVDAQWGGPAAAFPSWYGQVPSIGRTPYGEVNSSVALEASRVGLQGLVMWGASAQDGRVSTWNNGPLRAGDIIVMHWVPGVDRDLAMALQAIQAQHLSPALLTPDSLVRPDTPLSAS